MSISARTRRGCATQAYDGLYSMRLLRLYGWSLLKQSQVVGRHGWGRIAAKWRDLHNIDISAAIGISPVTGECNEATVATDGCLYLSVIVVIGYLAPMMSKSPHTVAAVGGDLDDFIVKRRGDRSRVEMEPTAQRPELIVCLH